MCPRFIFMEVTTLPIHPSQVQPPLKSQVFQYKLADLAADADLSATGIIRFPWAGVVKEIAIVGETASSGIDASNTSVWNFKVGSNTVATKTYNNTTTFPSAGTADTFTISSANAARAGGDVMTLDITNGSTANLPVVNIFVLYEYDDSAILR